MSKKNNGLKILAIAAVEEAASLALLTVVPCGPLLRAGMTYRKIKKAKNALQIVSAVTAGAGVLQTAHDISNKDKDSLRNQGKQQSDNAVRKDLKLETYEYIRVLKVMKKAINTTPNLDRRCIAMIIENTRKRREVFLKFHSANSNAVVINKTESECGIKEDEKIINPQRTREYLKTIALIVRGMMGSQSGSKDESLKILNKELTRVIQMDDSSLVDYLKSIY